MFFKGLKFQGALCSLVLVIGGCTTFKGVGRLEGGALRSPHFPGRSIPQGELVLDWPVDRARLTQEFKTGHQGRHWGLDLAAAAGTPIYAAHSGTVVYVGQGFSGFGKLIIIEFDGVWASFYAHLDHFLVSQGDLVRRGQRIGRMGNTGRSTGVHLHFELRRNRRPVDPLDFLP